MTPIRVALVGFGYAGRVFHAPLIAATPGLELRVLGTRRSAGEAGYPQALAVPDRFRRVDHLRPSPPSSTPPRSSHLLGACMAVSPDGWLERSDLSCRQAKPARTLPGYPIR